MSSLHWCTMVAVLLFAAAPASAVINWNTNPNSGGYTLSEIIDNGGIQIGDKVFTSFELVNTPSSPGMSVPSYSSIKVRGFFNNDGDVGIEFNGAWFANVGQFLDVNLEYKVKAANPFQVAAAGLHLNAVGSLGTGVVNISETIRDTDEFGQVIADELLVFYSKNPNLKIFDSFEEFLYAAQEIHVLKNIQLFGNNGIAHLSRFSQTYQQVPEPGTLVLAGVGVTMMLTRRRRRA